MATESPCPNCGLKFNCICSSIPNLNVNAHFALLTHENEQHRDTNTGQWLMKSLPHCSIHIWQRKSPCERLMALIEDEKYLPVLLFPSDHSISVEITQTNANQQSRIPLFIILDSTWQEASKMLRKSAWLKEIPLVHLTPKQASVYQLRKNQNDGHLCTLEVGAEVIRELGGNHQADLLIEFLTHYMQVFQADKSGHFYQPN